MMQLLRAKWLVALAASTILVGFWLPSVFGQTQEVGQSRPPSLYESWKVALQTWAATGTLVDMKKFQGNMTLKQALGAFYDQLSEKGVELPILVDTAAFKRELPKGMGDFDIWETKIRYGRVPRHLPANVFLHITLNQVPTGNATYFIRCNWVEITTRKEAQGRWIVPSLTDPVFRRRASSP